MARDFGLRAVEYFNEIANADLLISHKVEEPQPGLVAQRLEEAFKIELRLSGHLLHIRIDKYNSQAYSRLCRYVLRRRRCQSSCWIQ